MSSNKFRKKAANANSADTGSADPHRAREGARYEQPIASREFITSTLRAESGPVDFEALADILELTGDDVAMEALRRRVGAMIRDGQLIQNRRRGLLPVDEDKLLAGRIVAHPDGFGFVVTDDNDKDIFLNGKQMRRVLHGDKVVVCVTGVDRRGRREGRIVDVVERANKSLVGRLSIDMGTIVVLPDNKRIHQDLLIAPDGLGAAVNGDMVVAEIIEQPTQRHQPVGRITEVLGQHLRPGMEIDVALHSHGIPVSWPEEVLEQAATFSPTVESDAAQGRKDVRDLPLVTIDGLDARDFDDAVWCEALPDGWRLMVAIADVAHYVIPDSALDKEAVSRGTSVYFPGRVVPMLPEVLSNGLCSLNPQVDRLCMICEMTLSAAGEVRKTRFHNGIMRSHARLTYDGVSEMLTDAASPLRKEHAALLPVIEELHRLYKVLASVRRERGAIEFESNETYIEFDDNKKIKQIVPVQRNDAHKLIEECMILANIQAAAFLEEREIPALYRVHAGPKADRLEDLRAFLALRSLSLGGGDSPTALDYAVLGNAIKERTDKSVIQTVMLRSMQQAVYQPVNDGHFGLALDQYAHFTSPIRRYPDLLVHRALKFAISKGKPSRYLYSKEAMVALGESCSVTERRAEEASRDVVSWLKCEYMQDHVGAEFDGVISAVTAFGLFVELPDIHVEGLLHVTSLSRDYYKHDAAAQAMIGERTGRQYRLGDPIKVKVAAVNLEERKIDFAEAEANAQAGSRHASNSSNKHGNKPYNKAAGNTGHAANQSTHRHKKRKHDEQVQPDTVVAQANPDQRSAEAKAESAERRRQKKRKQKQKRRDRKRAELKAARQAENQGVNQADNQADNQAQATPTAVAGAPHADVQTLVATGTEQHKPGKNAGSKDVTAKQSAREQSAKEQTGKATGKLAAKSTRKTPASNKAATKQAKGKSSTAEDVAAGKSTARKVTAKKAVLKKTTAKKAIAQKTTAKKTTATKTTAKKAIAKTAATSKALAKTKAVSKKAASQAASIGKSTSKAAGKTTGKAANKSAASAASKITARKKTASAKAGATKIAASKVAAKKATGKAISKAGVSKKAAANKKVSAKKVAAKKVSAKEGCCKEGRHQKSRHEESCD